MSLLMTGKYFEVYETGGRGTCPFCRRDTDLSFRLAWLRGHQEDERLICRVCLSALHRHAWDLFKASPDPDRRDGCAFCQSTPALVRADWSVAFGSELSGPICERCLEELHAVHQLRLPGPMRMLERLGS